MRKNIAIDGPSGAGKSTIAKYLAKELGIIYVDTGAMYRALAYFCIEENLEDEAAIVEACNHVEITLTNEKNEQQVWLNKKNITPYIRTQKVSDMASKISVLGAVREKLVQLQQNMAKHVDVVMDGRDIGTVVLKDAYVKIYLTADTSVRAKRRFDELIARGEEANLAQIEKEVEERDYRDMNRENSPLRKAEDAVEVDCTKLSIEEVVGVIENIIKEKQ